MIACEREPDGHEILYSPLEQVMGRGCEKEKKTTGFRPRRELAV